jgi:hypothetical protein
MRLLFALFPSLRSKKEAIPFAFLFAVDLLRICFLWGRNGRVATRRQLLPRDDDGRPT